jgi:phosphate transport system substrate-binding protein
LNIQRTFAILLLFAAALQANATGEPVVIRGSASMLHLCQELVELYQSNVPGANVGLNVAESVQSLPSGENLIWQSVHPLNIRQKQQLTEHFGSEAREIPIAIEGTVVITNPANPVDDLNLDQLRAIYSGKVTNWKEVGGHDAAIRLYSTEAMVGGSLFFTELVLHGEDIDTSMRGYVNAKETEKAVADDVNGIGLIPLPAAHDVKYPRIRRMPGGPGIEASSENIRTVRYPLSAYVYWDFARDRPESVTRFLSFTISAPGQLAVQAAGYYPLNPGDRSRASTMLTERQENAKR